MSCVRYIGTLGKDLRINNGVLIDSDRISYYSCGQKIASVSVNNPDVGNFPALHTEMRGKFISAASDGEICANGVKRSFKTGEIVVDEFLNCPGFILDECFVQDIKKGFGDKRCENNKDENNFSI